MMQQTIQKTTNLIIKQSYLKIAESILSFADSLAEDNTLSPQQALAIIAETLIEQAELMEAANDR